MPSGAVTLMGVPGTFTSQNSTPSKRMFSGRSRLATTVRSAPCVHSDSESSLHLVWLWGVVQRTMELVRDMAENLASNLLPWSSWKKGDTITESSISKILACSEGNYRTLQELQTTLEKVPCPHHADEKWGDTGPYPRL